MQKGRELDEERIKHLRKLKLIEGRKPNFHISATVASATDQKAAYIRTKGFDDKYYQSLILEYLATYREAKRIDVERLLLDKLLEVLDEKQKYNKIKNLLQNMKNKGLVNSEGKVWRLIREEV